MPCCVVRPYKAAHPTGTNQPQPFDHRKNLVNRADFTGMVRTWFVVQVQNMPFERNLTYESDLADVLEGIFSLPPEQSHCGKPPPDHPMASLIRESLSGDDLHFLDVIEGKWLVKVIAEQKTYVQVSVSPPLGLGRRAKAFFTKGCGIHSEKLAVAPLIMMDRHQFYIPFPDALSHDIVRSYSEEIRRATQARRHLYCDRLPSRPLKIKLESCVEGMDFLTDIRQL